MRGDGAVEGEAAGGLADERQRRRLRLVDPRTHAARLRGGDGERGRERGRRRAREVGHRGVDAVGRYRVEGRARGEGGQRRRHGRERADDEHGVLEREGLAGDGEAGETDAGLEGEAEGVGVGGAPDGGARVGTRDGGRHRCGRRCSGAVDEGDAFFHFVRTRRRFL